MHILRGVQAIRTLLLLLLLAGMYGCGQKGDLYLPGQEAALHSTTAKT